MMAAIPRPALGQSLQEVLLRAKPAATLVVAEVAAQVTVACAGSAPPVTVTPAPFRETGSGWFISPAGWLVTNGRVVSLAHTPAALEPAFRESGVRVACLDPLLQRRGLSPGERRDVEDSLMRDLTVRVMPRARVTLQPSLWVLVPNGMRLPARVEKLAAPSTAVPSTDETTSGRDLALLRVDAANMPTLPLGDSTRARVGDRLHVIGFPDVVRTHELLSASAVVEASVTSGSISGFKEDLRGAPVIQIDAAATAGDSGGAAVNDRGEVIGVMAFVTQPRDDAAVQGFNFMVPVTVVRELVKDTAVSLESGAFNRAWWAALEAFFAADHPRAARHLAEANRILPDLPDVRRITAENDERLRNPPPRRYPWRAMGGALTAIGSLGCAVAWMGWWKRNRFRVGPREVATLLDREDPTPPVLLDVRDSETYHRSPVSLPRALHVSAELLAAGQAKLPVDKRRAVIAYCT
jgi:hypothetical protein